MEDFANLLQRDYGLKPQGKMAPMSGSKPPSSSSESLKGKSSSTGATSNNNNRSTRPPNFSEDDLFFGSSSSSSRNAANASSGAASGSYDDVFGGPPKFAPPKSSSTSYDEIFRSQPPPPPASKDHSLPVFDAPYGDDIFRGVRGTRSSSSGVAYENVFSGASSSGSPPDDLLGGFKANHKPKPSFDAAPAYDDELLPGMGSSGYSSGAAGATEPSSFIHVDDGAPEAAEADPFPDFQQPESFSSAPPPGSDPLESFTGYPGVKPSSSSNDMGDGLDGFDFFSSAKVERKGSDERKPPPAPPAPEVDSDEFSPKKSVHEDYIPASNFGTAEYSDRGGGLSESWITVHDVKLVTDPTLAPPPTRAPPRVSSGYENSSSNEFVEDAEEFNQEEALREERERLEMEERERERDRARRDREREVVEKVTRESRDRAARHARDKAERVAVERALQDSRMRAGEAAKQRAEAEQARQRAEVEAAKLKAEEAAKLKADAERKVQRAAVERANQEARERALQRATEQRARELQQQKEKEQQQQQQQQQQQNHRSADDLDSFFSARPSSAPRQRSPVPEFPKANERRGSSGASSVKKVSSASGIDTLTDLFGDNNAPGFRDVEGESYERRRARLDRDQRTQARAREALEEKHRRDVAVQREQAEKDRASETVDAIIKRWAAGKEGNLRALLSTLQNVLWPECGWQAVSITEVIEGAQVKKVYRRATLCVHPDKVQQKGATVQQKYIAEKVFDLLKEAWNKFSSEELF